MKHFCRFDPLQSSSASWLHAPSESDRRSPLHRALVAQTLTRVIQRADELSEFVAIYWEDGRAPLSGQVKKGLDPKRFTIRTVPALIAGSDAWRDYFESERPLGSALKRLGTAATGLDLARRELALGDETIAYDKLLIATGTRASPGGRTRRPGCWSTGRKA